MSDNPTIPGETHSPIRFGTDGWRGIIAENFTFANLQVIAQALGDYLVDNQLAGRGIAVSYDTRFMSAQFARRVAEVLAGNGIAVFLSDRFTPTPVLSFAVRWRGLAGGIMVTASHNPYIYQGIKFKGEYGGSALPELTAAIEARLYRQPPRLATRQEAALIQEVDFWPDYRAQLETYVDMAQVRALAGRVVVNPMHGAGCGALEAILGGGAVELATLNGHPDPRFGGRLPEPIPANLGDLREAVRAQGAMAGLALDGDADRFGVLDEAGDFVELHDLMPLLFRHLVETRGWRGRVVRTTSMHDAIDRMAGAAGCAVSEVPVGFRNVCAEMLAGDVLLGGEESGGFGYRGHIPERDGVLSCLLTLEMLALRRMPLSGMVRELRREFGPFAYGRIDRHFDPAQLQRNMAALRDQPPVNFAGYRVEKISRVDGIKFYFSDRSWMLMRTSDTEPLGRIYVGADHPDKVQRLLKAGGEKLFLVVNA